MQNLPITITTTQPVTPAQAPNPADNNAAQATETFGNVLARQRANSGESNTTAPEGKGQATSSAAPSSSTDNLPAATDNELEAPIPDAISALPGDMLAALLPSPTNANSIAAKEKPVSQAPTPDGVSTLPSDMLAALLSTPMPAQHGASTAARQQHAAANAQELLAASAQGAARQQHAAANAQELLAASAQGAARQQPAAANAQELLAAGAQGAARQQHAAANAQELLAAGAQGAARQQHAAANAQELLATGAQNAARQQPAAANAQELLAAGAQGAARQLSSAGQSIGEQTAVSLLRAQSTATPATDTIQGKTQDKTFSTVLETLGKDAAANVLSAGATQTSAQAPLPDTTTLASLTQNTASPIAVSQNGPVQAAINTPVTRDTWGDEFNQKITWLATQHEQTAELHLNPPHLGPLDVVLNISGDQATALFTSPHAAVREAVEQALPKLREMLSDNGIMLGNAMVNDQSPKEQQAWLANKPSNANEGFSGKAVDTAPASGTAWPARRHQGMVDTFV